MGNGSGSAGSGSASGNAVPPDKPVPRLDYAAEMNAGYARVQQRQKSLDQVDPKIGKAIEALAMQHHQQVQAAQKSPWSKYNKGDLANPTSNKCNIFVYDVMSQAGTPVPMLRHKFAEFGDQPIYRKELIKPLANDWANPDLKIEHWEVVVIPRPGDVAAVRASEGSGHVGIVLSGNQTISQSVNTDLLEKTSFGFDPKDDRKVVYRRYVP